MRTILQEDTDAYIEVENGFSDTSTGTITYLGDGQHFAWRSNRDGYGHLYLYDNDGTFVRQLTSGEWDVTDFHGIDEEAGQIYVTTTAEGPLERHLYRVPLAGGAPVQITQAPGTHSVDLSRDFDYFIDSYSNARRRPRRRSTARPASRSPSSWTTPRSSSGWPPMNSPRPSS